LNSALGGPGSGRAGRSGRDHEPGARRWWPILAPLAALAAGVSLLSPAGRHDWALALFRQPTRYSVLSFNHAAALPATAAIGEPIAVSFTVGNEEGHAADYRYVISAAGGRSSRILGQSARTVAAGATWTVTTAIRPACGTARCRIEVSLPGYPETIDFLLALRAPGSGRHAP
jgi:hypothetical protein